MEFDGQLHGMEATESACQIQRETHLLTLEFEARLVSWAGHLLVQLHQPGMCDRQVLVGVAQGEILHLGVGDLPTWWAALVYKQ